MESPGPSMEIWIQNHRRCKGSGMGHPVSIRPLCLCAFVRHVVRWTERGGTEGPRITRRDANEWKLWIEGQGLYLAPLSADGGMRIASTAQKRRTGWVRLGFRPGRVGWSVSEHHFGALFSFLAAARPLDGFVVRPEFFADIAGGVALSVLDLATAGRFASVGRTCTRIGFAHKILLIVLKKPGAKSMPSFFAVNHCQQGLFCNKMTPEDQGCVKL